MGLAPLLIAKQKDAKILKDDYKLGWLYTENDEYFWSVWGSSSNYENALKVAKQVISEHGTRTVFLSDTPVERNKIVNTPLVLKEISEELA